MTTATTYMNPPLSKALGTCPSCFRLIKTNQGGTLYVHGRGCLGSDKRPFETTDEDAITIMLAKAFGFSTGPFAHLGEGGLSRWSTYAMDELEAWQRNELRKEAYKRGDVGRRVLIA